MSRVTRTWYVIMNIMHCNNPSLLGARGWIHLMWPPYCLLSILYSLLHTRFVVCGEGRALYWSLADLNNHLDIWLDTATWPVSSIYTINDRVTSDEGLIWFTFHCLRSSTKQHTNPEPAMRPKKMNFFIYFIFYDDVEILNRIFTILVKPFLSLIWKVSRHKM